MILKSSIPVLFALLCVAASGQSINPFGPVPQLRICPAVSASDQVLDVAPSGSTWVCKTLTFTNLGGTASKAQLPATTVFTDQANTFGAFLQTFKSGSDFKLSDPADNTKLAHFDLSNITTLTERTINVPDANSTTAQAAGAVSHQFVTGMSAQGVFSQAHPTLADVNGGTAPGGQTYDYNGNSINNAVFNGANSGNSVALLNEQAATGAITGTGSAATIYTYTLPAHTLGSGKGLHCQMWAAHTNGSGAVTYTFTFGGTNYQNNTVTDTATAEEWTEIYVFNNSGSTIAQHGSTKINLGNTGALNAFSPITSAVNTGNNVTIAASFTAANTEQVTGGEFLCELIQ